MKNWGVALVVFVLGMMAAGYLFGLDIEKLAAGFANMMVGLVTSARS